MMRNVILLMAISLLAACGPGVQVGAVSLSDIGAGADPDGWQRVTAGPFYRGQFEHETMVEGDYEIMVTHVTNEQYAQYLNLALQDQSVKIEDGRIVGYYPGDEFHGYSHEVEIGAGDWLYMPLNGEGFGIAYDGTTFSALPGLEDHPVTMVTWFGARAYCEFYAGRLPSEIEWEKAARGSDRRPYPWGFDISDGNANYYHSDDPFDALYAGHGGTTPVGFFNGQTYDGFETQDSPSPYGVYDMAGNVWQWTGNVYENTHMRYMRGGSLSSYAYELRVWTRNSAGPDYFSPIVGFRCARDPID